MGLKFKKDDFLEKKFADFGLDIPLSETEKQAIEARKAAERFLKQDENEDTQQEEPKK